MLRFIRMFFLCAVLCVCCVTRAALSASTSSEAALDMYSLKVSPDFDDIHDAYKDAETQAIQKATDHVMQTFFQGKDSPVCSKIRPYIEEMLSKDSDSTYSLTPERGKINPTEHLIKIQNLMAHTIEIALTNQEKRSQLEIRRAQSMLPRVKVAILTSVVSLVSIAVTAGVTLTIAFLEN